MCPYVPGFTPSKPVFAPAMRVISSITLSNPAVITTTVDHLYIDGTIARIDIPSPSLGMPEINQLVGTITVLTPNTFAISIDTTYFTPFTAPTTYPPKYQDGQCVPIGEVNSILNAAVQNKLPYSAT
jgi:hypothetical protein